MGILHRNRTAPPQRHPAPRQRSPGSTALENRIMDLWDAGRSKQAIARELRITLAAVNRVFGYMADNGESKAARTSMIAGSTMLARAIKAAHPERIAA